MTNVTVFLDEWLALYICFSVDEKRKFKLSDEGFIYLLIDQFCSKPTMHKILNVTRNYALSLIINN